MSNYVLATFVENGVPKTGLEPKIYIRKVSDGSVIIDGATMTEVGDGFYQYDFTDWDSATDYTVKADSQTLTGNERYALGVTEGRVDVGKINGVEVDGSGTSSDPWGPI